MQARQKAQLRRAKLQETYLKQSHAQRQEVLTNDISEVCTLFRKIKEI